MAHRLRDERLAPVDGEKPDRVDLVEVVDPDRDDLARPEAHFATELDDEVGPVGAGRPAEPLVPPLTEKRGHLSHLVSLVSLLPK
ncbi:hypothetical protein [Halococcus hamelinensis]|uniref:hypothetical protein n=1 Tax=Halococcus hamelinensis TaxID=332168 RepID=UPI000677E962|nr:hypothetical protein [Halococcus hamelinensis]